MRGYMLGNFTEHVPFFVHFPENFTARFLLVMFVEKFTEQAFLRMYFVE